MPKNPARKHKAIPGQTVIWYPGGKVNFKNGVVAVVEQLYTVSPHQVQLCRLGGPYEIYDNVWHTSQADSLDVVSKDSRLTNGLWNTTEEHYQLFLEELDRIELSKEKQREANVAAEEAVETRRAAVSAVRAGEKLEDVAQRFDMDPVELSHHVEMGV